MVPFFVVDRPISLKIIQGLKIPRGKKIGLMAHANTSPNFRKAFRAYPHRQVVKMCDSAIFNLGGYTSGYVELFELYEKMGTDYGVMIDVFRDSRATLASAKKALAAYDPNKHHFKLVAVAQGKKIEEYLDCYRQLREMGFKYIAVGGLLKKVERAARYTYVRDEDLMSKVLKRIREEFDPGWLFALGCLHPSRLELFESLAVWGDYKGWIFEYKKRDESIRETMALFSKNHLRHAPAKFKGSALGSDLKEVLIQRQQALHRCGKVQKKLLKAKRNLKDFIVALSKRVRQKRPKLAKMLASLKSRGLLDDSTKGQLSIAFQQSNVSQYSRNKFIALAQDSRSQKNKLLEAERKLDSCNTRLIELLRRVKQNHSADPNLKMVATRILTVLETTEQKHRVRQVRTYIEENIISQL